MADTPTDLHTGAERLAEEIEARKLCYPPADAIAADPGVVALVETSAMAVRMIKEFYESERNEYMDQAMKDHRRRAVFAVGAALEAALRAWVKGT